MCARERLKGRRGQRRISSTAKYLDSEDIFPRRAAHGQTPATMPGVAHALPGQGGRPIRFPHAAEVVTVALLAAGGGAAAAQTQGSVDDHLARARAASGKDFDA